MPANRSFAGPALPIALLRDLQERLPAAQVALRARPLLGALLGSLDARASLAQALLQRRAVQCLGRDRLLHEHQRVVFLKLQVALGLGEAHDLALRAVEPQLG